MLNQTNRSEELKTLIYNHTKKKYTLKVERDEFVDELMDLESFDEEKPYFNPFLYLKDEIKEFLKIKK